MNIKQKLSIIKFALYFNDVIREGKISNSAQKNGIKAGNLSKIISDFEAIIKIPLLQRGNKGVYPTNYGLKISEAISRMEQDIEDIESFIRIYPDTQLKYHFAPGMTLKSLDVFQQEHPGWNLISCDDAKEAHLAILTTAPTWNCEQTCLQTSGNISQKLWITCQMDKAEAVLFYDFIIRQLLS